MLPVLVLTAGCDLTEPFSAGDAFAEEARVSLKLELQCSPPSTRAFNDPAAWPDDVVEDGVILQFDDYGELLEMVSFTGDDLPEIQVRRYQQTDIYIVANPTVDLSGVSSKEDFLSSQSEYGSNSAGRLEMTGYVSGVFNTDETVNVSMERMLAKITVDDLVFKVASTLYDYTGAHLTRGYMERTPKTCSYSLTPSTAFINAYTQGVDLGIFPNYHGQILKYTQGAYKVWEYGSPQSVYCYPNASEDRIRRNRLAVSYRLVYLVPAVDGETGEEITLTRYDDNCVHLVLPQLRPNTEYELERLTIIGAKNNTVYLGTRSGTEELPVKCSFRMRDMTSGELIGNVEGEVEYEYQDY